jgi:hypothetical protein
MNKKRKALLIITAAIVILFIAIKIYQSTYRAEALSMTVLSDSDIKKTIITPHMEQELTDDKNVLYCSTFQLCWNEMKDFMNGNIELSGSPDIVPYLNKSLSTKDDLSEKSYVAAAGYKKDNLEDTINKELDSKFDHAEHVDFKGFADDDIIAYSYLYKNLKFDKEFETFETPIEFPIGPNAVPVKAFGINDFSYKNSALGKQVDIIDYQNSDDFIIRLKTASSDDELILAKVIPGNTLLETIELVDQRIVHGQQESLNDNDVLKIPKFSFKLTHQYSEIIDKSIKNTAFSKYVISEAMQDIAFVLDERGAILESKSLFTATKDDISKYLVFDQPFLLYMKEKGAKYPYFAIWVENTELMAVQDE